MALVLSVNVGRPQPNPYPDLPATGIAKQPQEGPVEVRDPGPKTTGLGSGLVGDFIGDMRHHGGRYQAVYAYGREDLDAWEQRLGRSLPDGFFGENLTTLGLDVNDACLGEHWRVGAQLELVVSGPRVPCPTFRGWVGEAGWLKVFTQAARPGAYLAVAQGGRVQAGDPIEVTHRPSHGVTVALAYRAVTTSPELLVELAPAGDDLSPELQEALEAGKKPLRGQARPPGPAGS